MSQPTYSNLDSREGIVSPSVTLELKIKSRKITITNSDGVKDLKFKFNDTEEWGTLYPSETFSECFITRNIYLEGDNISYRVWSFG